MKIAESKSGLAAALLLIALAGCGGKSADAPETFPVTGRVLTATNQPWTGGAIYLHCAAWPNLTALAEIRPDGAFSIYTMDNGERYEGAVAGEHAVRLEPPMDPVTQVGAAVVQVAQPYRVTPQPNHFEIVADYGS